LAQGQLDQAKALMREAQDNVEWCQVIAPISGRVGRRLVTPGNLVTAGGGAAAPGTLLTTIYSVDPIYHYVDVDERSILKYRRLAAEGRRVSARDRPIPVFLQLLNEEGFPHEGVVDFVDNKVDPTTGTLRARGVFPNPTGTLTPGYFGRARVPGSGRYKTLLVPDEAVGTDQDVKYLLSVDADGTVQSHVVKPGALFGTLRSIEKGIGPDERIIVNGIMRVRPGMKVKVQTTTIDAKAMQLTAPGSAATQALPMTRPFVTTTAVTRPTGLVTPPATAPATRGTP
jgi:RND family efflux transporter MFP subunit